MLSEGSLLRRQIQGELVDVTPAAFNEHKILRYGLPFYIPFSEVKNEEYN
jgi:CRISPR-associated protein Csm4